MADFNQENEIMVGNKRLRKIKRPKQHAGPYAPTEQQNPYPQTPQQEQQYYSPQTNHPEPSQNTYSQPVNLPYVQEQPVYEETQMPSYVEDDQYTYEGNGGEIQAAYPYDVIEKKKVLWIALACLFIGVLAGKFVLGSSSQVVQSGLQGVVINPEVPKGRSRCGVAEKTQGCVLYVMNPQRQELNGRDFYDLAAQLTGRQRFMIETGNMRYSSIKIKPGAIAQLNIPPLQ